MFVTIEVPGSSPGSRTVYLKAPTVGAFRYTVSMSEKLIACVAQKAIIEYQGKMLIVLNAHDNKWQLPGGRLHADETPEEGLHREIREETQLDISNIAPFSTGTFKSPTQGDHFLVVYRCQSSTSEVLLDGAELADAKWVSVSDWEQYDYWPVYHDCMKRYFSNK